MQRLNIPQELPPGNWNQVRVVMGGDPEALASIVLEARHQGWKAGRWGQVHDATGKPMLTRTLWR